jgi:hypothetical protein
VFYDDRNVSSSQCEVFCAVSYDAGDSWEDFKVSDVSFTPSPIQGLAGGYFGDYLGITARGGKVYPVWTDNRTGVALTYVSPFTTSTMTPPTDLQATLNEGSGVVSLTWQHPLGPTFDHFNIYRNFQLIGTADLNLFTDTLPDYGQYRYIVTAYYTIEGESGGVNADVRWGDAQANVDPLTIEESLVPGASSFRYIDIANNGELPLDYEISFSLPETAADDSRAYCAATGGCGEYIRRVMLGEINNFSECGEYQDFTSISTTLIRGFDYELRVENGLGTQPTDICKVWIDWNQNTSFTDDDPIVLQGTPGVGPYTAVVTVPETALNGPTRMRARLIRSGSISPCGVSQYGEVEDYTVNVVNWISAEPLEGTILPGGNDQIALSFTTGTLPLGSYHIDLNFISNDPDQPVIPVPVTMNIQDIALAVSADKDSLCQGASTRIYANVTGGSGNPSYQWTSDPEGFSSTEQDPVVSPEITTTYFVEVTDGSIVLEDQVTIGVVPLPDLDLGDDIAVCQGGSATFDAGPGFATYHWSDGSSEQTLTVYEPGSYWVDVTNSFGCLGRDTVNFTLFALPSIELGDDASFCEGTTFSLSAGSGFSSYLWSTGSNAPDITVSDAGTYWVEVMDENGCQASDTVSLTLDPLPGETSITSGPITVDNFQNPTSDYSAGTAVNALTYQWLLEPANAGFITANGTSAQVAWSTGFTGTAQISLYAANDCGDGPVSGSYNVDVYSSQGLEDKDAISEVKVFPNPNDGTFILEMNINKDQIFTIKILSNQGKIILQEKTNAGQGILRKDFNLSSLPAGNYTLLIFEENNRLNWRESIIIR